MAENVVADPFAEALEQAPKSAASGSKPNRGYWKPSEKLALHVKLVADGFDIHLPAVKGANRTASGAPSVIGAWKRTVEGVTSVVTLYHDGLMLMTGDYRM